MVAVVCYELLFILILCFQISFQTKLFVAGWETRAKSMLKVPNQGFVKVSSSPSLRPTVKTKGYQAWEDAEMSIGRKNVEMNREKNTSVECNTPLHLQRKIKTFFSWV